MIPRGARALLAAGFLGLALFMSGALPASVRAGPADTSQAPGATSEASIPPPTGYVNDVAGVIGDDTRAKLEAFLDQLQKKTGVQFAVLTVPTTAPLDPSDYKVRVFEQWKIGEHGKDNGLLLLVAIREREARFETGYGLEGTLPDGLQSRIFRRVMAPRFQANDYAGGITQGVLEVSRRIAAEQGVTLEWDGRELRYDATSRERDSGGSFPISLLVFVVVVIVLLRIARSLGGGGPRGFGGGWGGFGGGWGGYGGGFGGGGFGGGGFGGGGGSFGGFGGGASGGGGGGGKW